MNASFRTAPPQALAAGMLDARARTLAFFDCLAACGMDDPARMPMLPIVNPPRWELGHIAWFAEWYILREASSSAPQAARRPSIWPQSDTWFNSNTIAHDTRWSPELPPATAVRAYCRDVHDAVLDKLGRTEDSDAALYPYRLILAHEDMHGEAFAYTLQTLNVASPALLAVQDAPPGAAGEIRFAGGSVELGGRPGAGFVFDNEKWAHSCEVKPFGIDATLVSNARYREFVDAGGYREPRFWSAAGREWLAWHGADAPRGWRRDGNDWHQPRFGALQALAPDEPVRHICLYEAQAYCAWAGRRLPKEAEWVCAAQSGNPAFRWGELWEWTDTIFAPYPGFSADAYREYSAPYFGTHQVLRGASFATPPRMRSAAFRNFYMPQRNDIFAGFRTCAL
ncbi:MAG: selenoneine synthase SenA [Bacillota bacterium]